jgi:hypothetical protein
LSSGIECLGNSNVTIQTSSLGSLSVMGGNSSPGIGSAEGSSCRSLSISNGSIEAEGGTGIGTGMTSSYPVWLGNLLIRGGHVKGTGRLYGAGIGTGFGEGVASSIGNIPESCSRILFRHWKSRCLHREWDFNDWKSHDCERQYHCEQFILWFRYWNWQ